MVLYKEWRPFLTGWLLNIKIQTSITAETLHVYWRQSKIYSQQPYSSSPSGQSGTPSQRSNEGRQVLFRHW